MNTLTLSQHGPIDVVAQFLAGNLPAGMLFNRRAALRRNLAPTLPLANEFGVNVELAGQVGGRATTEGEVFAEFHTANHSTVLVDCNSTDGLSNDSSALSNAPMQTIEEIRHAWLLRLIDQYGSLAELNHQLERARNDATLQQIKNKAPNTRTGAIRSMGSELAREIEAKLNMERGTLDNPPPVVSNEALEIAKSYDRLPPNWRMKAQEDMATTELAAKAKPSGPGKDRGEAEAAK